MLPKKNRLNLTGTYTKLKQQARRVSAPFVSLLVARQPNPEVSESTFGIIVPKKMDKRSTRRQRTKRLISEAIRTLLPRISKGYAVIVFPRTILWKEEITSVTPQVEDVLKKAGLISEL